MSDPFGNPEDQFSRVLAHVMSGISHLPIALV